MGEFCKDWSKNTPVINRYTYVGIEKDKILADQARKRVNSQNVSIVNSKFEQILILFYDQCIDLVVMVLPDPDYIDPVHHEKWSPFYGQIIHSKLKDFGVLKIVTEIIDDLLEPVSDVTYSTQVNWLIDAFFNIGFRLLTKKDGPPIGYTSLLGPRSIGSSWSQVRKSTPPQRG